MSLSEAVNLSPSTLPQATLDVLANQKVTNVYLPMVETFWNPHVIEEYHNALKYLNEKTKVLSVIKHDYRLRPSRHYGRENVFLQPSVLDEEIKQLGDEIKAIPLGSLAYGTPEHTIALNKHKELCSTKYHKEKLCRDIRDWRPLRVVEFDCSYNDHKANVLIDFLRTQTHVDFFAKLLKMIEHRKAYMDELNRTRRNPIRNVRMILTITPERSYITATWEIHRSSDNWSVWTVHHKYGKVYLLEEDPTVDELVCDMIL